MKTIFPLQSFAISSSFLHRSPSNILLSSQFYSKSFPSISSSFSHSSSSFSSLSFSPFTSLSLSSSHSKSSSFIRSSLHRSTPLSFSPFSSSLSSPFSASSVSSFWDRIKNPKTDLDRNRLGNIIFDTRIYWWQRLPALVFFFFFCPVSIHLAYLFYTYTRHDTDWWSIVKRKAMIVYCIAIIPIFSVLFYRFNTCAVKEIALLPNRMIRIRTMNIFRCRDHYHHLDLVLPSLAVDNDQRKWWFRLWVVDSNNQNTKPKRYWYCPVNKALPHKNALFEKLIRYNRFTDKELK